MDRSLLFFPIVYNHLSYLNLVPVSDVLIVGSGLAGLHLGLKLTELSDKMSITIITKRSLEEANTRHAQGGIAAVVSSEDKFENHVEDTLIAGDGLCRKEVVATIVEKGPEAICSLQKYGVMFDIDAKGNLELGREGGHNKRRIAHVKDITGAAVQNGLVESMRKRLDRIDVYEFHEAIDLAIINGRVAGCYVLDVKTGEVKNFQAKYTVLASGGAGKTFMYTSNPDIATGDGIAIAYRAGATIANMEFLQFHPTLYYNPDFKNFLISEALRGEGALILNTDGERVMKGLHPLEDLAPRDIVARAMDAEMKRTGADHLLLDITHLGKDFIKKRFPGIHSTLLEHGLDMTKEPIPVVPASHYTIGGIRASTNGMTDLPGLFAIGEVAYTGLHGANRLASNSLLEAAVTSSLCAEFLVKDFQNSPPQSYSFPPWEEGDAVDSDEAVIVSNNWKELRRFMWNYVGIVRSKKRIMRAKHRIDVLREEVQEYYWQYKVTSEILELRNLVDVADLIVTSALHRKESRGAHYTLDFPEKGDEVRDTLIQKKIGVFYSELIH